MFGHLFVQSLPVIPHFLQYMIFVVVFFFVFRVLFLFTCDQIASCCIFLDVANSYARFFTNSPNYFSAAVLSSSSSVLLLFLFFSRRSLDSFRLLIVSLCFFNSFFSWLFRFNAFHVMWLVMRCDARFVAKSISNKFSAPVCVLFSPLVFVFAKQMVFKSTIKCKHMGNWCSTQLYAHIYTHTYRHQHWRPQMISQIQRKQHTPKRFYYARLLMTKWLASLWIHNYFIPFHSKTEID